MAATEINDVAHSCTNYDKSGVNKMIYKNIVITGGAGFVGSNLAVAFKRDNLNLHVTCVDNLKRRGSELNLSRLKQEGIDFVHCDIRNPEDFYEITVCDLLIDCAAESSVLAGYTNTPWNLLNTNFYGTINSLEFARKQGSDVVFLSTSRVYPVSSIRSLHYIEHETRLVPGDNSNVVGFSSKGINEDFSLNGSRTLYGSTKLSSEIIISEYIDMYHMRVIIDRCAVITGAWQMGKIEQGFMALWVARHLFGGSLSYIGYGGKGKQVRDVLLIDDLYDLLLFQLKNIEKHNGVVYNVGGGNEISISLLELTKLCQEITGNRIDMGKICETRPGDIPYYISDCTRVKEATGWSPKRDIEKVVKELYDWLVNNEKIVRPILTK